MIRNGVIVPQVSCIDPYDGSMYPPGSEWNTDHCMKCNCLGGEMECCSRYNGVVGAPEGCEAVVNPETCQYEMYRIDNPSEPCI
ncbi:PREDICTED: small serum protein 5-like [Gekko japonicus]|uniref:Small serum protein 5-like n=1 Tax=Gekko japonicus TaxID=146911 RepID=A0ABM1KZH0_GEKJA|nr:PREDICTED: small serum protein 5-like [Gekko japonicus]